MTVNHGAGPDDRPVELDEPPSGPRAPCPVRRPRAAGRAPDRPRQRGPRMVPTARGAHPDRHHGPLLPSEPVPQAGMGSGRRQTSKSSGAASHWMIGAGRHPVLRRRGSPAALRLPPAPRPCLRFPSAGGLTRRGRCFRAEPLAWRRRAARASTSAQRVGEWSPGHRRTGCRRRGTCASQVFRLAPSPPIVTSSSRSLGTSRWMGQCRLPMARETGGCLGRRARSRARASLGRSSTTTRSPCATGTRRRGGRQRNHLGSGRGDGHARRAARGPVVPVARALLAHPRSSLT